MNKLVGGRKHASLRFLRRLILIFQVLALIIVVFTNKDVPYNQRIIFSLALVLGTYLTSLAANRITKGDKYIILIALFLFSIGSIMIYRLEPSLAIKQSIWLIVGVTTYFLTYGFLKLIKGWERWGLIYYGLVVFLFLITLVFGSVQGGAKNWIIIGPISIQPVEIIKIVLVFYLASYFTGNLKTPKLVFKGIDFSPYLMMASIYILLGFLFLQAELGTALIVYGLFILMQFIYEEDRKQIYINLGLAIVGSVLAYLLFNHVRVRISTWLDPWSDINNTGYQITQSLFAIASGGFFGTGLAMGQPDLIPLAFTDFIFPAICEEMGIFAGIGLLMLFLLLVYRGFKIAVSQENEFFAMVALGLSIVFALQAFVIFAGVLKLIPLTGITIPFVTYGGSSIVSSFMAIGILQYTSEYIKTDKESLSEENE